MKKDLYRAYLDIETTSLSPSTGDLTVIGLCLERRKNIRFLQMVGDEISSVKLMRLIKNVDMLYTYNGSRFDLIYINAKLGVNLASNCIHKDLMYDCWKRNLYGGLKEVERKLDIKRKLTDINGWIAVQLWWNYVSLGDKKSLKKLLEYNKEDVLNLRVLRKKLCVN